jgi:hypothetical protein
VISGNADREGVGGVVALVEGETLCVDGVEKIWAGRVCDWRGAMRVIV